MTDAHALPRPDRWSRAVALGRVVLPVGGILLLSSVFLLSSGPPPADAPALREAEDILREGRLTAPDFAGVTADGAAIRFAATRATADPDPAQTGAIAAEEVRASLTKPNGETIQIVAEIGTLDAAGDLLDLQGDVRLTGPRALDVRSDRITGRVDRTDLTSPGPVSGVHDIGTVDAGAMRATGGQVDFTNGVTVIYRPPN